MRLRRHQTEALAAWRADVAQGKRRGWVVLPPGAGKTRVGVEAVKAGGHTGVVLSPNTAIQGQWSAEDPALRCLTYQSLAVMDPNADDDGETVSSRLHPNGRALIDELAAIPNLMLVLDECHHLLRVWGRLLAEVLDLVPEAHVLGLTATPVGLMTAAEAALESELFGEITYAATIPEVVAEGDLAPFLELAWLTSPTAAERDWLSEQESRLAELLTHLATPAIASVSMFEALDALTADRVWTDVAIARPDLADAVLRLAHAGQTSIPVGAVLRERHRRAPDVSDWVLVLNQWLPPLVTGGDDRDAALIGEVAGVLGSIGYRWTRRGIVAATPTVDRVLARSQSKARAAVDIMSIEASTLGDDLRAVAISDFESAGTLPRSLADVTTRQAGSARQVLEHLLHDEVTAALRPLLVTARTVAGARDTLSDLATFASERGASPTLEDDEGLSVLTGWTTRQWVRIITEFFELGHAQVLVGTRGLLGEGWDARSVNSLVDLTSATTATAVVQLRGRGLRLDPRRQNKVTAVWSVCCVTDGVLGDSDWNRLVRKHTGYVGLDSAGDLVDGVAHLDDSFSESTPPPEADLDQANSRAIRRSSERDAAAEAWRLASVKGAQLVSVVRVAHRHSDVPLPTQPATPRSPLQPMAWGWPAVIFAVSTVLAIVLGGLWWLLPAAVVSRVLVQLVQASSEAWQRIDELSRAPGITAVAAAVAEALHAAGLVSAGADGVSAAVVGHQVRCQLVGVTASESELFAQSLDEALHPVGRPRYLVSRTVSNGPTLGGAVRAALVGHQSHLETWHPVPAALERRRADAELYLRAWRRYVGDGRLQYARGPEGQGLLEALRGDDPWQLTSAIRMHWQ